MNSKIEKIGILAVWYLVLMVYALIVPERDMQTRVLIVACTSIITVCIFGIYISIRNNYIKKRIATFSMSNSYDDCLLYLNRSIKNYPKLFWLKFEKLLVLFLKGDLLDFKAYDVGLKKNNSNIKKIYKTHIQVLEQLHSYLLHGEIPLQMSFDYQKSSVENLVWLLSKSNSLDSAEISTNAYELYSTPNFLIKSVSALILFKECYKKGEYTEGNIYAQYAKHYAPSLEVLSCIEDHINKVINI